MSSLPAPALQSTNWLILTKHFLDSAFQAHFVSSSFAETAQKARESS
jgi:hypothetical protein